MMHLTMEQLVALREPGLEPGEQAARAHLESCASCRTELERLHQRVARLKALPSLRPSRGRWPAVQAQLKTERRAQRLRRFALVGLAAAASIATAIVVRDVSRPQMVSASTAQISEAMARSQALEQAIDRFNPESRVLDGRTASIAEELENRIAAVDRQLEMADLLQQESGEAEQLRLWRERVGLLDALVDVHLTHASNVGL